MKREVWRGQNSLRFFYYRYKDSPYYSLIILFVVICVCFILILNIIIPQIYNWFSVRDEIIATQGRINTIHRNLDYMSLQVNKTTLENNRQLALRALPVDKDFGDIINAVAISAVKAGVSVDDFSFTPGQISKSDVNSTKSGLNLSNIKVTLSLTGGVKETGKFIAEINEKLPVNEIENVDTSNGRSTISIIFYSKPYKASAIQFDQPIKIISAENGKLLGTLSEWNANMNSLSGENQPPPASSEAVPLF
jgi:Tfp pilus assembly protein PilO